MCVDLARASLNAILTHQSPSGAIIACPTFPTYGYSWLRDGSFIAYALDRAGAHTAAAGFHRWVAGVILAHRERAESAIARAARGLPPAEGHYLHCRYTLDGAEGEEGWPNFQLDGYGTWIWALEQHLALAGAASPLIGSASPLAGSALAAPALRTAVELTARYLQALWSQPTYDCWEEHGDKRHPATLACLYGGLRAAGRLLDDPESAAAASRIQNTVLADGQRLGRIPKFLGEDGVDASLLWCSTPFRLVPPGHPLMEATLAEIERRCLDSGGGVHRYPQDTYYGGGAWLLLTAWLGWHYAELGRRDDARRCLEWVEARALPGGEMPEQVAEHLHSPPHLPEWEARWGKSACPLIWSHAMHLVLRGALAAPAAEGVGA